MKLSHSGAQLDTARQAQVLHSFASTVIGFKLSERLKFSDSLLMQSNNFRQENVPTKPSSNCI